MPSRPIVPAAPSAQTILDFSSPIGAINSWGMECGSYGATPNGGDTWLTGINMGNGRARFIPFVLNETLTVTVTTTVYPVFGMTQTAS